jgi:mRNA-degrading endonuclease toxin of MazEF toxin-antitoxin module
MIELKQGDIVLFAERGECTGKLRPGVVVQRDSELQDAPAVALCGLTPFAMPTHRSRIAISPSPHNGLDQHSYVMIDKILSICRPPSLKSLKKMGADEIEMINTGLRRWLEL